MLNNLLEKASLSGLNLDGIKTMNCPLCGENSMLRFKDGRAYLYACVCGYRRSTTTWNKSRLDIENGLKLESVLSKNAIRMVSDLSTYPEEIKHSGVNFVYGTIHNNAAVYYRETWLRSHMF